MPAKSEYKIVDFDENRRWFLKASFVGAFFLIYQTKSFADVTIEFEIDIGVVRFLIRYDSGDADVDEPEYSSSDVNVGKIDGKNVIVNSGQCIRSGVYESVVLDPDNLSAEDIELMIEASPDCSIRYE